MAFFPSSDLTYISLDLDGEYKENKLKKLTKLCIQELIDDTSLLSSYHHKLPNQIHASFLYSAIAQNNTFSVENLMRWCPYEKIEMPIPNDLKSLSIIPKRNGTEIVNIYNNFVMLCSSMLSVFFDLIESSNTSSQLRHLDFGTIPIGGEILKLIKDFLSRVSVSIKQCTLTFTASVSKTTDLYLLTYCIEQANILGLKLVFTGIFFYNNNYPEVSVINLLEYLNEEDLKLIDFNFSSVVPSFDPMWDYLCNFKSLKYLNVSYLSNGLIAGDSFTSLASALTEFPFLERLVLKGIRLDGKLCNLFLDFCNKNHKKDTNSKCCILHSGTLEYLDISGCVLIDTDIEVLRDLALSNCLKYLNISDNSLEINSTCETLLSFKSSLSVLEMNHCFRGQVVQYDPRIFPLSEFKKLRYLSMKGFDRTGNSAVMLACEIQKLPELIIRT